MTDKTECSGCGRRGAYLCAECRARNANALSETYRDAARWRWWRDTLLVHEKRLDLPYPLPEFFARDGMPEKYHTAVEYDEAVDACIEGWTP